MLVRGECAECRISALTAKLREAEETVRVQRAEIQRTYDVITRLLGGEL